MKPEYMILVGLLLLIVSLVASMFFGAMVPKDDDDYITDMERVRRDSLATRFPLPESDNRTPIAEVGDLALFPDGTLAACIGQHDQHDKEYMLGDGRIFRAGHTDKADILRGPFPTDRLT